MNTRLEMAAVELLAGCSKWRPRAIGTGAGLVGRVPPNKRNDPSLQSLSWTQTRHGTANHSCCGAFGV